MSILIDFETKVLISEAARKGKELLKENQMPEVLNELRKEFMLSPSEIKEVETEITKPDTLAISEEAPQLRYETIYFKNIEEANQAEGILLYKKIPWKEKGTDGASSFVQFENANRLKEAQDALGRRWDFIEKEPRKVAVIEFDDLTMYQRIVEYMQKNNMIVDFGTGSHELQEDVHNVIVEKGKKSQPARYSFYARPRSESTVLEDAVKNVKMRSCHARRRFK